MSLTMSPRAPRTLRAICTPHTLAVAAAAAALAAAPAHAGTNLVTNAGFTQSLNSSNSTSCNAATGQCSEEVGPNTGTGNNSGDITGWSSAGYNFLFVTGTATTTGGRAPEYGQYLSLWGAANGGLIENSATAASTWDGNGPTGGNFVALDADYQTGALSQTITGLTKGHGYYVTLSYAFAQQYGFSGATNQNLDVSFGSDSFNVLPNYYVLSNHAFSGWMTTTVWVRADNTSDVLSFLAEGNPQLPPFVLVSGISVVDAPEPASCAITAIGLLALAGAARRRASLNPAEPKPPHRTKVFLLLFLQKKKNLP